MMSLLSSSGYAKQTGPPSTHDANVQALACPFFHRAALKELLRQILHSTFCVCIAQICCAEESYTDANSPPPHSTHTSRVNTQAIQSSGRLEALSVYNNAIGPEGCRALAAAVGACRRLKVVEFLPGNSADTQDIKPLAHAVKRNRRWVFRKGPERYGVLVVGLLGFVWWQIFRGV
jgi:hypothetical protein